LPLFLRINRPTPERASGEFFEVTVRGWGPPPTRAPAGFVVEHVRWEQGDTARRQKTRLRIGGIGGTHGTGERWDLTVGEAIDLIERYQWRFRVRTPDGPRLVVVRGRGRRPYLRGVGDGSRANNLRNLPEG
jgi:hypothetical protein